MTPPARALRSQSGDDRRGRRETGVVIPLRSFADAKARLAETLDAATRHTLARAMAERVVAAAGDRPVVIVSSAADVGAWADTLGLARIDDPGSLDAAADAGRAWVRDAGCVRVVVAHADLPLVTSLDAVTTDGAEPVAVIVPDHRDDGTPVLALPVAAPFCFAYGAGSAARHIEEANRCGLTVRIVRDHSLAFDLDVPSDLDALRANGSGATGRATGTGAIDGLALGVDEPAR